MNINALIEQCVDVLFAKGYNEASIRSYQDKWRQYVLPFAKSQGTTLYSKDLGERLLEANLPGKSLSSRKSLIRYNIDRVCWNRDYLTAFENDA